MLNTSLLRIIDKAANAIVSGDSDTGLSTLSEGKKMLKNRQKLIRLADSEPYGWDFVHEYTKDSLAADSDDEKNFARVCHILKAEDTELSRQMSRTKAQRAFRSRQQRNTDDRTRSAKARLSVSEVVMKRATKARPLLAIFAPTITTATAIAECPEVIFDRPSYRCGRRGHMYFGCPEQ